MSIGSFRNPKIPSTTSATMIMVVNTGRRIAVALRPRPSRSMVSCRETAISLPPRRRGAGTACVVRCHPYLGLRRNVYRGRNQHDITSAKATLDSDDAAGLVARPRLHFAPNDVVCLNDEDMIAARIVAQR